MMPKHTPAIVEVIRMEEGVIVTFENGEIAIYSPELLYSIIGQAERADGLEGAEDK